MSRQSRRRSLRVHFEKRDAWIGVYWDRRVIHSAAGEPGPSEIACVLSIYVCLIPFLPVVYRVTEDLR